MTLATSGSLLCRSVQRSLLNGRRFPRSLSYQLTSSQGSPAALALALRPSSYSAIRSFYSCVEETPDPAVALHNSLAPTDVFSRRHIGPSASATDEMLKALDPPCETLDDFVKEVLPPDVLSDQNLQLKNLVRAFSEKEMSTQMERRFQKWVQQNNYDNYIGCGYYGTVVPEAIKRNVLENPGWYTSYTPYQAEVSQGRLEALLNFQTMVTDLTGLDIANASVLDEPTAAAEAMTMILNSVAKAKQNSKNKTFVVSSLCHPQTLAVLRSRADGFGIKIVVADVLENDMHALDDVGDDLLGVLIQYPDTLGGLYDFSNLADRVHKYGGLLSVATDLLALTLYKPPGEFGADIAFGSSQRFGVPMGNGGPYAAFFACKDELKRKMPGRLVGISKDRLGNPALRLALQTREQHIRREKATSNICTAQALLANMSAFYAIYHGPTGLKDIAKRVVKLTRICEEGLRRRGYRIDAPGNGNDERVLFDTIVVDLSEPRPSVPGGCGGPIKFPGKPAQETTSPKTGAALITSDAIKELASRHKINLRYLPGDKIAITLDETTTYSKIAKLIAFCFPPHEGSMPTEDWSDATSLGGFFNSSGRKMFLYRKARNHLNAILRDFSNPECKYLETFDTPLSRESEYLKHPVFNSYHSETELMRYIWHLQSKDISLVHSMIPLGSCTMKLNAASEMQLISWSAFADKHPFAPESQMTAFLWMKAELETFLAKITDMDAVSLMPNSGAQGEFTGLRVIKQYHAVQGNTARNICLIPVSAHGTNPASSTMAGFRVMSVKCDHTTGNLDLEDLRAKCEKYKDELAAMMITYPSTFGVFEPEIRKIIDTVHEFGGQVYMDGANMNAQIGLCSPGQLGADVCHLNLHKTFCIPHGGGGPGVGPIAVKSHLSAYLPTHPVLSKTDRRPNATYPTSGAPFGSAGILPISWAYIKMMGGRGLTAATKTALLNANYILSRLKPYYGIVYTNAKGRCAHEFILDLRPFKSTSGVEAIDVAKRLQDYGFHAPTMSWPVHDTLMIEPTESESKEELDRFCDALISIRHEIEKVEKGEWPKEGNVLKNAPHSQLDLLTDKWDRSYTREEAAYPLPYLKEKKFWPTVTRVDDVFGDMNLFCTCSPVEDTVSQED